MKKRTRILKKANNGVFLVILGGIVLVCALIASWLLFVGKKPIASCANSISCVGDLRGEYQPGKESVFMGRRMIAPSYLTHTKEVRRVLGETTDEQHILVDLAAQRLTAYEGKHLVLSFPVATGKWGRTPTGEFRIWSKLKYTRMEGGNPSDGTYYNLYNVPYTMFFGNDEVPNGLGFALHGAYWHNNFGHPMSHGCVNIRQEDAAKLFDWTDPARAVITIFGEAPEE